MKRCSISLITRKMLIKPHWDTISHTSTWQNSKAWQSKRGKAVENSPHTLGVGMQNDINFKKTMVIVKKPTHALTFLTQQTAILKLHLQKYKNIYMYKVIHYRIICNFKILGTT